MDKFEGRAFNSPNDVAIAADGAVYFTDPDYGLRGAESEIGGNWVFRFDPQTRNLRVLVKDFDKPNGIAFSPDGRRLYITDAGKPKHIRVFNVDAGGGISNGRVFCTIDKGTPDGIRCDVDGRVWSSAGAQNPLHHRAHLALCHRSACEGTLIHCVIPRDTTPLGLAGVWVGSVTQSRWDSKNSIPRGLCITAQGCPEARGLTLGA